MGKVGRIVQYFNSTILVCFLCFSQSPVPVMKNVSCSSFRLLSSFLLLTTLCFCMAHSLPKSATTTTTTLSSMGNQTDRLALLDFKGRITQDPLGILSSWNDSTHFCDWQGVTCGRRHRRVTELDLESRELVGSISPFIGNLTFLRVLSLDVNNFHGDIPQEVGGLFRLEEINLNNNSLGGKVPVNLSRCSNLKYLRLYSNRLEGKLPAELGSLSNLLIMAIHINNLIGELPHSFGNLSSLQLLSSARNSLEGNIPNELGQLTSLTFLGLGSNRLTGEIPPSLYNLTSLNVLSVSKNQLYGSLPPNIGLITLPNLTILHLGENHYGGHISVSLSNASGLSELDLNTNNFVGGVPPNLGGLQSLEFLNLGDNNLGSGGTHDLSFLTSLTNCTNLRILSLVGNKFGGDLPSSIANFSIQLNGLYLGENQITGSIPPGIGNLVNLIILTMERNQVTGSIPSSIGMIQNLNVLALSGNRLTGRIPSSVGNITQMYTLDLNQNHLTGSIPLSLGACKYLQVLDLSRNNLNGTIPIQVIGLSSLSIYLDLSRNSLTGFLPQEVRNLKNIAKLSISENKLSGKIPIALGECSSLEELYMNENFFDGDIPPSLSSLKALQVLDLSCNNLSGNIPKSFENLSILRQLNFSFNQLEGEVPVAGIFRNASAISVTGNNKLCGGILKLKLRVCSNQQPRKRGKSPSFKVMVPIITAGVIAFLGLLFYMLYWKRKPSKKSSLKSSLEDKFLRVSYDELLKATDGFASTNLIGAGSFGSVYKGILHQNDKLIAVKVLNLQQRGASKSFIAECEALRKIRHRNLLKIITSCSSVDFKGNDFKALVFEFMPNGSLENWLHPNIDGQHLSRHLNLTQRINIAIDVAFALDYLHHHCQTSIVHCDLKPSNVLLDDDMIAHVGDFGLAKFLSKATSNLGKDQSSSVAVKGSIGYIAPEYGIGSEVSMEGDVYSYGILLLEMVMGRRPTDDMFKDDLSLHIFCKMVLPEQVMEIMDSRLLVELNEATNIENQRAMRGKMQECLICLVRIGVACSAISPGDRMDMKDVLAELQVIKEVFLAIRIYGERPNRLQLAG